MNPTPLLDKIALVTGGAQGLGEAICHRLALEGAHVVVADLNGDKAQSVAQAHRRANRSQAVGLCGRRHGRSPGRGHGRADDGTHSAGWTFWSPMPASSFPHRWSEFDAARWRKVIDVNLVGYFLCAKHAARVMRPQGSGTIVQINSKSGKKGSLQELGLRGQQVRRHRSDPEHRPGAGRVRRPRQCHLPRATCSIRPSGSIHSTNSMRTNQGISEAEVRQRYVDQVPMKRGCTYDDVTNMVVFLASDQVELHDRPGHQRDRRPGDALGGGHAFVGFGFGAIQAGLFLYEAQRSGAFEPAGRG